MTMRDRAPGAFVPAALLALAVLFVVEASRAGKLRPEKSSALAPAISLRDPAGKAVTLASLRGRSVLVNFWATWCPPCRAELPDLEALAQEKPGCLALLGVEAGCETPAEVAAFVRERGLSYPVVLDDGSASTPKGRSWERSTGPSLSLQCATPFGRSARCRLAEPSRRGPSMEEWVASITSVTTA